MDMKQKLQNETDKKKTYAPPKLVNHGNVRSLTQSGTAIDLEPTVGAKSWKKQA